MRRFMERSRSLTSKYSPKSTPTSSPNDKMSRVKSMNKSAKEMEQFVEEITKEEREELTKSWELCTKTHGIGLKIVVALIMNQRSFGRHFGVDSTATEDEIKQNTIIINHGQRIQSFLDSCLVSIDNGVSTSILVQFCYRVGSIHFYKGVNFIEENYIYFQFIAQREILKICENSQEFHPTSLRQLWGNWSSLLTLLIQAIRNGFFEEAMENFFIKKPPTLKSLRNLKSSSTNAFFSSLPEVGSPVDVLDQEELQIIRDSWLHTEQSDLGLLILLHLLSSKPLWCEHFGIEPTSKYQSIVDEPVVKVQAQRIYSFLDTIVNLYGIQSDTKLNAICQNVGVIHFQKGVNFTAENWLLLKKVTIEQVYAAKNPSPKRRSSVISPKGRFPRENNVMNEKFASAWNKLMNYIIGEMKRGFMELTKDSRDILAEKTSQ